MIDPAVIEAIEARSWGACEANTPDCIGSAQVFHHRRLKAQGRIDTPENLLHICNPCHVWIHGHTGTSYEKGWLIRSHGLPRP